jgi:hypothetical protein
MQIRFLLLFIIVFIINLNAKDEIEEFFEDSESSGFNNAEIEAIEYYRENPIDLINADPEILIRLKILSLSEAKKIYNFIRKHDEFEYSMITDSLGMSTEIKFILESCTFLKERKEDNELFINFRTTYKNVFEEKYGFRTNNYMGSPLDLNNRFSISQRAFEAGVLTDKKEGEVLLYETYSAYAMFKKKDVELLVGDYNIDFAGGTLFSGAFGKRKTTNSSADIIYLGDGITPNRSTMISDAFRGFAVNAHYYSFPGKMNISLFYSNMARGATVNENNNVTSIYSAGYYRTENEINKKNQLNEEITGVNIQISKGNLIYGINSYYLDYDKRIITDAQSQFSGKYGLFSSGFFYYNFDEYLINAELSIDANTNEALILNFENTFYNQKLALNFRHISENFRSPFGNVLSENSYIGNEFGMYLGYEINSNPFRLNVYSDLYKTYAPTYFVPFPVKGLDIMAELNYRLPDKQNMLLRVKSENKTEAFKDYSLNTKVVSQISKTYCRAEYSIAVNNFNFRTRYEITFNNSKYNKDDGHLGFFEMKYMNKSGFAFNSRLTLFDTDSYDSAIWLFEYAVPGNISTQPLYGQGFRITSGIKYSIHNFDIRLRYGKTVKNNVDEIGSGYELIDDNKRSDIILQVIYSY